MSAPPRIRRILYATDFLQNSRLALDYAIAFAHAFHASLHLLHVVDLSSPAREAEAITSRPSVTRAIAMEKLDAIATGVRRAGIEAATSVEDGEPCEKILGAVDTHAADLLVLGVHGVHRGLEHLLIGSNAEKIVLSAKCPVLTIGAHVMAGLDLNLPVERILYYADFTPEAANAAPFACLLSRELHVPIEICQVLPDEVKSNPSVRNLLANDFCEALGQAAPDADSIWHLPSFQLNRGGSAEELLERAASLHGALIVLGAHCETYLGRHLHTSFVYQLLAEATCPVISVLQPVPSF